MYTMLVPFLCNNINYYSVMSIVYIPNLKRTTQFSNIGGTLTFGKNMNLTSFVSDFER